MSIKLAIRDDILSNLPKEFCAIRGVDSFGYFQTVNPVTGRHERIDCHTDKAWLDWLEGQGGTWEEGYDRWDLVTLPDNVTDYAIYHVEMVEDVCEDVAWVVDGKLHWFRECLAPADD